ncbi:MAG: holo-ACP synthase [Synergistaceae bacterium]|jgi:holo-[acyl-carrier protein] synthase|nr:holo-ACP synthase [Synergistaceae bacterium]
MIAGIGTDMCQVSRMRKAALSEYFLKRVFSEEEIGYARSKCEPERHFASAFAAKEALAKASGLGMFGIGLAGSWVRRTENGPVMMFSDELLSRLRELGAGRCWLSLTHEGDYALAFVVLESVG